MIQNSYIEGMGYYFIFIILNKMGFTAIININAT
jgi:hypothetical protein